MAVLDWVHRKRKLLDELRVGLPDSDHPICNVCVEIMNVRETMGECIVWDLGLGATFEEAPRCRKPRRSATRLSFEMVSASTVHVGDCYMLVGAAVAVIKGPVPGWLQWPSLTQDSGAIKLTSSVHAIAEMAEFFAGGLNAWSRAAECLPVSITMRVDSKPLAVQMMHVNDSIRPQGHHAGVAEPICADVADLRVLSKLSQEEALLVSPPCQPFSSMGRGQGLDAVSAKSWDRLFKAARFSQRRYIVLENVCGLPKHADFQEILQAMKFCGFTMVSMRMCDSAPAGCVARPRVFLIFWNNADWRQSGDTLSVPSIAAMGPPVPCSEAGSLWKGMPDEVLRELLLNEEEMSLLARRDLLPSWLAKKPQSVWSLRTINQERPFPSVTAAYHRSVQMPRYHVRDKGLHVPLVETACGFRRLCKWEVIHSLGASLDLVIPRDEADAISLIGESFPPLHALEAILLALSLHPDRRMTQQEIHSLFQSGLCALSPERVPWSHMTQVHFQGWCRLVCAASREQEEHNLASAVQHMWQTQGFCKIGFGASFPVVHSNDLPDERSFFQVEAAEDHVWVKTLRPGWPPRWTVLCHDEDSECSHVRDVLASMWGTDPLTTVFAWATAASEPHTLVIDEIATPAKSYMRLVLLQGLQCKAVWFPAKLDSDQATSFLELEAGAEVLVNGMGLDECPMTLEDGDVICVAGNSLPHKAVAIHELGPSDHGQHDAMESPMRGKKRCCQSVAADEEVFVPAMPCHDSVSQDPGQGQVSRHHEGGATGSAEMDDSLRLTSDLDGECHGTSTALNTADTVARCQTTSGTTCFLNHRLGSEHIVGSSRKAVEIMPLDSVCKPRCVHGPQDESVTETVSGKSTPCSAHPVGLGLGAERNPMHGMSRRPPSNACLVGSVHSSALPVGLGFGPEHSLVSRTAHQLTSSARPVGPGLGSEHISIPSITTRLVAFGHISAPPVGLGFGPEHSLAARTAHQLPGSAHPVGPGLGSEHTSMAFGHNSAPPVGLGFGPERSPVARTPHQPPSSAHPVGPGLGPEHTAFSFINTVNDIPAKGVGSMVSFEASTQGLSGKTSVEPSMSGNSCLVGPGFDLECNRCIRTGPQDDGIIGCCLSGGLDMQCSAPVGTGPGSGHCPAPEPLHQSFGSAHPVGPGLGSEHNTRISMNAASKVHVDSACPQVSNHFPEHGSIPVQIDICDSVASGANPVGPTCGSVHDSFCTTSIANPLQAPTSTHLTGPGLTAEHNIAVPTSEARDDAILSCGLPRGHDMPCSAHPVGPGLGPEHSQAPESLHQSFGSAHLVGPGLGPEHNPKLSMKAASKLQVGSACQQVTNQVPEHGSMPMHIAICDSVPSGAHPVGPACGSVRDSTCTTSRANPLQVLSSTHLVGPRLGSERNLMTLTSAASSSAGPLTHDQVTVHGIPHVGSANCDGALSVGRVLGSGQGSVCTTRMDRGGLATIPGPMNGEWRPEKCPISVASNSEAELSETAPLNPRLPWPRYEPGTAHTTSPTLGSEDALPPTQKFEVCLPGSAVHTVSLGESMQGFRKTWPAGGLKGGSAWEMAVPKSVHEGIRGWWLGVWNGQWRKISFPEIGGRTVRQERELLGLMSVDPTASYLMAFTSKGGFRITWDYKFPHSARDAVAIVSAPSGLPYATAAHWMEQLGQYFTIVRSSENDKSALAGKDVVEEREAVVEVASPLSPAISHEVGTHHAPAVAGAQHESKEDMGQSTLLSDTAFIVFANCLRCVKRDRDRTIGRVLEDEWGIPSSMCVLTISGKHVSAATLLVSVPIGIPVRVTHRLKGGAPACAKKLKELLLAKGVPEEELQARAKEISNAIGDHAIQEAFNSFDSWQALKAKCHGKLRIIKQSEAKAPRSKVANAEEDVLQLHDPWAEALQSRQLTPEVSFFRTSSHQAPTLLQSVSHGCSGLVLVDPKEAKLLARANEDLSPDELSIVTLGDVEMQDAARPHRVIQFPCRDAKGAKLLVTGTLVDLGATKMRVAGEESIYAMPVMDTKCITCELHKSELEEWPEFAKTPVRHLRKMLGLAADDVVHSWGKKYFRAGKQAQSVEDADSAFLMLRLKATALETALKVTTPGLFTSPRLDSGEADPDYKVVWCSDRSLADVRILAQSTQGCLGIVKSRSGCGVRVRCTEYSSIRAKMYPEWKPQQDTPYDAALPMRYELHHVHPGAGKEDLQGLLNMLPWKALVLKQHRPKQWLIASATEPPRDTILTQHGCILVLPAQAQAEKGKGKGRAKGKKGNSPSWLLGAHPAPRAADAYAKDPPLLASSHAASDIHGPIKKAVLEVEQKMEERLATMREEAKTTRDVMQADMRSMREEFQEHVNQQRAEAASLSERVNHVESNLASQLTSFMSNLSATLNQQNADLTGKIQAGQETLRTELTAELRSHMSSGRKRTPPPPQEDSDKRMRDGE